LNSRLDELQAALLLARAAWLNALTERRREIAATYYREIRNPRSGFWTPPLHEKTMSSISLSLLASDATVWRGSLKIAGSKRWCTILCLFITSVRARKFAGIFEE